MKKKQEVKESNNWWVTQNDINGLWRTIYNNFIPTKKDISVADAIDLKVYPMPDEPCIYRYIWTN